MPKERMRCPLKARWKAYAAERRTAARKPSGRCNNPDSDSNPVDDTRFGRDRLRPDNNLVLDSFHRTAFHANPGSKDEGNTCREEMTAWRNWRDKFRRMGQQGKSGGWASIVVMPDSQPKEHSSRQRRRGQTRSVPHSEGYRCLYPFPVLGARRNRCFSRLLAPLFYSRHRNATPSLHPQKGCPDCHWRAAHALCDAPSLS